MEHDNKDFDERFRFESVIADLAAYIAADKGKYTFRQTPDFHSQSENRGFLVPFWGRFVILHLIYNTYMKKNA